MLDVSVAAYEILKGCAPGFAAEVDLWADARRTVGQSKDGERKFGSKEAAVELV